MRIVVIAVLVSSLAFLLFTPLTVALDSDRDGLSDDQDPYPTDYDNDAIPDAWETQHGLEPSIIDTAEDTDNDGLLNLGEYQAATDPMSTDSDGDGVSDYDEVNAGKDPLHADRPIGVLIFGVVILLLLIGLLVYKRKKRVPSKNPGQQIYSQQTFIPSSSYEPNLRRQPSSPTKSKQEALEKLRSFNNGREK